MSQPQMTLPVMPSPMPVRAGEPIWTDLDSPNPEQSRAFYAALFGWEYQISEEFGGHANAFLKDKKAAGISPMPPGPEGRSAWTVYFASDDLAADVRRVQQLGGQLLVGPMQIGEQGHLAVLTDPGGATFGLWQDDQHGGFTAYDGPGRVVWAEVNTRASAPAVAFYRQLLNADAQPLPGADYHQLLHGETGFAGVSGNAQNWEGVGAGGWMVYFYTGDVDQTARMAEQSGGQVLVTPFDMDFGRMAVLADPAGAVFSVMNPQPAGR